MHNSLESYGWNAPPSRAAAHVYADMNLSPARVAETGRDSWRVLTEATEGIGKTVEELDAVVSG